MVHAILDLMQNRTSRANANKAAKIIHDDIKLYETLLDLVFTLEHPMNMRLAWVLDITDENKHGFATPLLGKIIEQLVNIKNTSVKRCLLRMLTRYQLNIYDEKITSFINYCYDWLSSVEEPVAVKVYCMEIIFNTVKKEPDLLSELQAIIEMQYETELPGFQSRGNKILKAIKRLS
jgi:hypothetical protein